jgi:phosphatidylserine/phosphatidylglycerophosphate/cardiolipin synthase-like enzyme
MMHAKTLVADGVWSSIGTLNFDNRSLALNEGLLSTIPTSDAAWRRFSSPSLLSHT